MSTCEELVRNIDKCLQALDSPDSVPEDDLRRAGAVLVCAPMRDCIHRYFTFVIEELRAKVASRIDSGESSSHPDAWKYLLENTRAYSRINITVESVGQTWFDALEDFVTKLKENSVCSGIGDQLAREVVFSFPIVNDRMYSLFLDELDHCIEENDSIDQRICRMWELDDGKRNRKVPEPGVDRKPQWPLINNNGNSDIVVCGECGAEFRKPQADVPHSFWPSHSYDPGARVRRKQHNSQSQSAYVVVLVAILDQRAPWRTEYTVKCQGKKEELKAGQLEPCGCECDANGSEHNDNCHWKFIHALPMKDGCNHGSKKFRNTGPSWELKINTHIDDGDDGRFQLYRLFGPGDYVKSKDKWIPTPPANETALLHIVAGLTPNPLILRIADAIRVRVRNHWGHDTIPESDHRCYIELMVTFVELMCDSMGKEADQYIVRIRRWLELTYVRHALADRTIVDELKRSLEMLKSMFSYEQLRTRVDDHEHRITEIEKRVKAKFFRVPPLPDPCIPRQGHVDSILDKLKKYDVVGVVGPSGIGKSELANLVAHRFDRAFYLVVGEDANILQLQKVLLSWYRGGEGQGGEDKGDTSDSDDIGFQSRVQSNMHELQRLHNDQELLIVLDDVWHSERAELLGCRSGLTSSFLITAREHSMISEIVGSNMHVVGYMDPGEATDLTLRMIDIGGIDEVPEWAAEYCDGLPFAIYRLAVQVRRASMTGGASNAWDVVHDKLENDGLQDSKVKRLLSLSLNALDVESRDRFLDLGIFPHNFEFVCSDLKEWWFSRHPESCGKFNEWINRFFDIFLIDSIDQHRVSFKIHDMVVDFIRDEVDKTPDDTAARVRWFEWKQFSWRSSPGCVSANAVRLAQSNAFMNDLMNRVGNEGDLGHSVHVLRLIAEQLAMKGKETLLASNQQLIRLLERRLWSNAFVVKVKSACLDASEGDGFDEVDEMRNVLEIFKLLRNHIENRQALVDLFFKCTRIKSVACYAYIALGQMSLRGAEYDNYIEAVLEWAVSNPRMCASLCRVDEFAAPLGVGALGQLLDDPNADPVKLEMAGFTVGHIMKMEGKMNECVRYMACYHTLRAFWRFPVGLKAYVIHVLLESNARSLMSPPTAEIDELLKHNEKSQYDPWHAVLVASLRPEDTEKGLVDNLVESLQSEDVCLRSRISAVLPEVIERSRFGEYVVNRLMEMLRPDDVLADEMLVLLTRVYCHLPRDRMFTRDGIDGMLRCILYMTENQTEYFMSSHVSSAAFSFLIRISLERHAWFLDHLKEIIGDSEVVDGYAPATCAFNLILLLSPPTLTQARELRRMVGMVGAENMMSVYELWNASRSTDILNELFELLVDTLKEHKAKFDLALRILGQIALSLDCQQRDIASDLLKQLVRYGKIGGTWNWCLSQFGIGASIEKKVVF